MFYQLKVYQPDLSIRLFLLPRGAKEAVAQWAILRSRKRPERVIRSKQRVEATAMPAAPTENAEGANLFRLPVAEVSKEVRSFERKQSPQCGVATIENAGVIYLLGSTKKPDQL